ncbi:TPA: ABC transporter substrate-binding protein [Pseudomonas aeruginosa]|uniref:ABC transporter substrate-binding protein n=1 Tax=Pseudomonas aeruginosa TaxID=287 RepID=UPI000E31A052|nr:ABC transporter substrate-binding protein [Pseudomonas aeruginosa]MBX6016044.1 ABC transporter substrate-binding protein [Pseudomonas aeruginosa]NQB65398.1 ABC transporter substrate-binding protein [Pseudomonas aeruginosa]NQC01405.1 ABC transporter substrate-binding protein [Pseudomonas aeruginosa]RPM51818.1 nitrate ABC transporter substrate-binding protein [Pseudomonas aeruginosa]HBP0696357.1 ABC transporter substrate-binding protein [Pseudomonas aeruginosa]
MRLRAILASLALALTSLGAQAETIRVAIGTQDTTINCAAGGLLIRELGLLEKYLPRDGRYKDADYRVEWKNFTSGAPLTNEMVAGKLDFGAMADFPGTFNGVAFAAAGKRSLFISVLSGSTRGSGNGIVVPSGSPVQSLAELKGQTISVPFASTAHGMLLRAVAAQGWDPQRDVTIIAQPPEIAGSALQANKIAAHADFVPFAELFPNRGFARKIYDGSQANAPTFHGVLVDAAYAERYPEVVVAYLRASIEANRLLAAEPEKYSELIEKVTGIEAEVNYLFHGPLGLQTRDQAWKPEYRQALATSIDTLKLLKKADRGLDVERFVDERYIREAYRQAGLDYQAALADYAPSPLRASDARSGRPIEEFERVAQIWVKGEARVRHYASPESALADLAELKAQGKAIRAIYAQDRDSGIKLLANQAWFVRDGEGRLNAFLLREQAQDYARRHGGEVRDFAAASQQALALR